MNDNNIRKAEIADAEALARMYNHYVIETTISFEEEPVSTAEMARRISDYGDKCSFYVYEENSEILGYCYAHPWKERAAYCPALETTIYLRPDAFGRGIGKILMEYLIEESRRKGYHALIACITDDNHGSIAFHRSIGFEKVSHFKEVGLKFGQRLGVIDMEMIL